MKLKKFRLILLTNSVYIKQIILVFRNLIQPHSAKELAVHLV